MATDNGRDSTSSGGNSWVEGRILLNYIETTATHHPDKPAVYQFAASEHGKCDEGQYITLSYSDIVVLVNKICWQLRDNGVKCGNSHVIA
jgi:hypothetical protein